MRAGALLVIPGLALVLFAAHLLHAGWVPLTALALLLIGLLLVRRPWAAWIVQGVLVVAAIEWALTAYGLAQLRMSHGQPYLRLLAILGGVTLFTALAAATFRHPALHRHFRLDAAAQG
jgi:hypothetical protein